MSESHEVPEVDDLDTIETDVSPFLELTDGERPTVEIEPERLRALRVACGDVPTFYTTW